MYVRTGFVKVWNEKEDLKRKLEIKKESFTGELSVLGAIFRQFNFLKIVEAF